MECIRDKAEIIAASCVYTDVSHKFKKDTTMKIYEANDELSEVLLNHGFIETTSKRDKLKGKKSFKTSKNARKEINFNYIHIQIEDSCHLMDDCYKMTEKELTLLLLYFKLSSSDRKELTCSGNFKFKSIDERFASINSEINELKRFKLNLSRQNKLERIIDTYNSINI